MNSVPESARGEPSGARSTYGAWVDLWLNGICIKVRDGGRIVSRAVMAARRWRRRGHERRQFKADQIAGRDP